MSEQQQPTSVQALVEAIDQRARQAGTEGATTVLRGLLGSVSDTLASIEARLAAIEESGGDRTGGPDPGLAGIDERLQSLNARLGRLEEAFVRAVEDSSAGTVSISDRVVEAVSAFMDERAANALELAPAPPVAPVDPDAVAAAVAGRVEAALTHQRAEVASAVEQAVQQMFEHAVEQSADQSAERLKAAQQPIADQLRDLARSLDQLPDRVEATRAATVTPIEKGATDKELRSALDRISADVERLLRQEQSGRLVQLVEARIGAGLDAIVRRIDDVASELSGLSTSVTSAGDGTAGLRESVSALERSVASAGDRTVKLGEDISALHAQLSVLQTSIAGLQGGQTSQLDVLEQVRASTTEALEQMKARTTEVLEQARGSAAETLEQVKANTVEAVQASQRAEQAAQHAEEQIGGRVRSEAEQLTQRVAALASAVERLRLSVDALAEESAQTLGRKATEVGRRLAADWGLRGRRSDGDSNDRGRELGPGR